MLMHVSESDTAASRPATIDDLEAHLLSQLNGRVCQFHLELTDDGLILRGHVRTYYAKQFVEHAVMLATDLPIVANEIQVS